ncbi:MAG: DUF348 domain-containing protein [Firmicutes bacterium]|nr:DUF348 domain-containing protein [Bacillota bacterium]
MKRTEILGRWGINRLIEVAKGRWLVVIVVGILLGIFAGVAIEEKAVVIQVDGQQVTLRTFKSTVGEALSQTEIQLGAQDRVIPDPGTKLKDGMQIQVLRAFPVQLIVDGEVREVVTPPATVQEVLELAGIKMGPLDQVSPALSEAVTGGVRVQIIRVEEKMMTADVEIPYPVDRRQDQNLERGINRVLQKGRNGLERQLVKVTYENGKEVKREVISSEVIKEPVKAIIAMGSLTSVSRGGQRLNFDRAMVMTATAYTYTGHNTATGIPPYVGGIAVDPKVIPLGTKLYVDGYGFATAVDCGGAIVGNRIDVFLETERECQRWGRRQVKVFVLN